VTLHTLAMVRAIFLPLISPRPPPLIRPCVPLRSIHVPFREHVEVGNSFGVLTRKSAQTLRARESRPASANNRSCVRPESPVTVPLGISPG